MENKDTQIKKDAISRRVDDFLRIVNAVGKDARAVLLTASLILNFYLGNKLINQDREWTKYIMEEVRRQATPLIKKETTEQLYPYKERLDTTLTKVNSMIEN